MGDFWQGEIPTLQRFATHSASVLEQRLTRASGARSVSLLLPCHAREVGTAALHAVIAELRSATWLRRVVIGLDQADESTFHALQKLTASLEMDCSILWLDGPEWRARIEQFSFSLPASGKGRNVWLSLGWIFKQEDVEVIALHDCDIQPYSRELLVRLVYPVARPEMETVFSKGYYARFNDQLQGRLTRLLFQPLLAALLKSHPSANILPAMHQFRYPLAGEIAMHVSIARQLMIDAGWGLETRMLADVLEMVSTEQICQVDLCDRYEHRHHPVLPPEQGGGNLAESAVEIIETLLSLLPESCDADAIFAEYEHASSHACRRFAWVAEFNQLGYDAAEESRTVAIFSEILKRQLSSPRSEASRVLPAWERIRSGPPLL